MSPSVAVLTSVRGTVKTPVRGGRVTIVSVADQDDPQDDPRALRKARFLVLASALEEELGSNVKAAKALGVHESYIHKLRTNEARAISQDKIDGACALLGLSRSFFTDPTLGDRPDYHEHLAKKTHVELHRDDGYPEVERYIADMETAGTPVAPAHATELRSYRSSAGAAGMTREVVIGLHRGMVARDARRQLEAPLVDTAIEVERGQRPLPPGKRRKN